VTSPFEVESRGIYLFAHSAQPIFGEYLNEVNGIVVEGGCGEIYDTSSRDEDELEPSLGKDQQGSELAESGTKVKNAFSHFRYCNSVLQVERIPENSV
jgi:hypothetical protein